MKRFFLSLLLIPLTASADAPVIWQGGSARWLPSSMRAAGLCKTDSSGIQGAPYATDGIVKMSSGVPGAAASGTDYAPATSGSAIQKGNGSGGFSSAVGDTDYQNPISIATFGSAPSANGATFTSDTLTLQPADATHPGGVTTGAQTFAGAKTFSSTIVGSVNGNAATVTTNANLTGPITSSGNATSIASQTGTGTKFVVDTSPTLVTPILGIATATSLNGMGMSCSATTCTLSIASGKTFTVSNTLTFTGADSSSVAFSTGGTVAYTANNLSVFAATTSAQLAGVLSDETGTGSVVFSDSPTFTGTPSIPTGTTGVTQSANDNSTKIATTAYADLKLPKAGGTMTGLLTVKEVKETVVAGGTCSTSYNVDPTAGSVVTLTLNGACAIGVTNLAAGHSFTVYLTQSSTTAPTFTSAYKWTTATVPTFSTSATKYDTIACGSPDGTKVICGAIIDAR